MLLISALLLLSWTSLPQERRYTLSVDVELVNVSAMVVDTSGRSVEGLTQDDFHVLENGKEQALAFFSHDTRVAVSIGVLIDASGSLQDKLQQSLQTAGAIARALSERDEMFIMTFNTRAVVRQKFSNNSAAIQEALRNVRAGGETAVYDAIATGLSEMETAKNRKRILLLLTDGFDTRSKIKAPQIEALLANSEVLVYAIGIDDDNNDPRTRKRPKYHIYEYMLLRLTSAGNGRLVRLYSGKEYDLRGLAQALLGELQQEYTMGYYRATTEPQTTGSSSVEVRVTRPGARLLGERLHVLRHDPRQLEQATSTPVR
jgi:VWFA-related protein